MANINRTKRQKKVRGFSDRLFQERYSNHLTQEQLAEKVGVSTTTISEYERDKKQPTIARAVDLAAALGVSLDYLCGLGPESIYERNPVMAWVEAIKALKMEIKSVNDSEVVLTYKEIVDAESGVEISAREIRRFFEEYQKLQILIDTYAAIPGGDEIIKVARNHLLSRFKNLPKLPPYTMVKNEK